MTTATRIHNQILPLPDVVALIAATCEAATAAATSCAVVVATTWPFIVVTGVRSVVAGAGAFVTDAFGLAAGTIVAAVTRNVASVPVIAV